MTAYIFVVLNLSLLPNDPSLENVIVVQTFKNFRFLFL